MKIELRNLLPIPLVEIPHENSGVWENKSLVFESPQSCLVIAGSGKGKTTLLSAIYGIRKDYHGEILIDDSDISGYSPSAWSGIRKRSISYIFQGLELFDDLTAMQNILLKNRLTGFKTEKEIRKIAEIAGISRFLDKKTGILSFGQKQRVAIIRALCQEMKFLLADEIFSHLDKKVAGDIFSLIREELKSQGAGLIMTSLDPLPQFEFERLIEL